MIHVAVELPPECSQVVRKSRPVPLTRIEVWSGDDDSVYIFGAGDRKQRVGNVTTIPADRMDELALRWLEARGYREIK